MSEQELIVDALEAQLGLEVPAEVSEASVLGAIEAAVSRLLQADAGSFFQLMYRLDISESRLGSVLEDRENGVTKLATLIYERQLQKIRSRKESHGPVADDEELRW